MNKKFTKLMAALALLTFLAVPMGMRGQTSDVQVLTNANIVAAGAGQTGYREWSITDSNNNTWNAYAIKNQHSNATSKYHYLQIRAKQNNTYYYIQVPELGTQITSITMTVSSASQPMTGGGNSATLYFSSSSSTSSTGTGVASGTGSSSVTIDCSSLNLNTGYITASAGVRIWDVSVTYTTGGSSTDPSITISGDEIQNDKVTLNWNDQEVYTADVVYGNMDTPSSDDVTVGVYSDESCETVFTGNWFTADFATNSVESIEYAFWENNASSDSRTVYMRVETYNAEETDLVPCNVIAITQSAQPQVATPTFSPTAGAVASGTQVTINCTTTGATIQYSTNGTNYSDYTNPIEITAETTLYAKATATGYADSEVATAHYTIRGNAEFVEGIYTEPFDSQASFDKWIAYSVSGDETWVYSQYGAYIKGNSNNNEDWLISPKMVVDNEKLYITFECVGKFGDAQMITVWYSTDYPGFGNPNSYNWTALTTTPDIPYHSTSWDFESVSCNISATEDVYFAFKYTSTTSSSGTFEMKPFTASQCHTLSVSDLVGVNTFVFAGSESETLFENEGYAPVAVGLNVMVSVDVIENYEIQSFKVNNDEHVADIQGGMYLFDMPNQDVTITATAERIPFYTVTFTTNGIDDVTMEVNQGDPIGSLPTANASYIPEGYTFVGWYNDDYEVSNIAPTFITEAFVPTSNVTLKAVFAEMVTPAINDTWTKITDLSTVTEGVYAIITSEGKAFNGNMSSGHGQVTTQSFSFDNNNIANRAPEGTCELTLTASGDGYTMHNTSKGFLYASKAASGGLGWHETEDSYWYCGTFYTVPGDWGYAKVYSNKKAILREYSSTFRTYGQNQTTATKINMAKKTEGTPAVYENYRTSLTESFTLTITGYDNGGGWNLIASPVTVSPATVEGMVVANTDENYEYFDLYYFDQTGGENGKEWKNYKAKHFNLVPGKGYLYANKTDGTYTLAGTSYSGNGIVYLDYFTTNPSEGMWGLNLIGNPYNANTTIESDREFYIMNDAGTQIIAADDDHKTIAPMQGIIVKANETGESVTFTPANEGSNSNNNSSVVMNLSQNRGGVIDRAIVRFGNGGTLPKIQLFENSTKLYITQDNKDYAVVSTEAQGEMPVNFKAAENGTYTLTVNPEGVEMNYLHLIDNMTGADIDLLAATSTGSVATYTFNASTTDYSSRFRLVFAANNEDGVSTGSTAFAFYSNGTWVINNTGEATLQVVDVNGRILSSETVNGSVSKAINAPAGVYMLRLINGNDVKTQKIVVR